MKVVQNTELGIDIYLMKFDHILKTFNKDKAL